MNYDLERREALDAGERALLALREAKNQLESAKSWGFWDILGGGSFISFIKHSKIYKAKTALQEARFRLEQFSNELKDISVNLNIDIGAFLTYFDLFDNFLADIMVQSRLREAVGKVDYAISQVEAVLTRIR